MHYRIKMEISPQIAITASSNFWIKRWGKREERERDKPAWTLEFDFNDALKMTLCLILVIFLGKHANLHSRDDLVLRIGKNYTFVVFSRCGRKGEKLLRRRRWRKSNWWRREWRMGKKKNEREKEEALRWTISSSSLLCQVMLFLPPHVVIGWLPPVMVRKSGLKYYCPN